MRALYLCENYIYANMRVKLKSHKYNSHNLYIRQKIILIYRKSGYLCGNIIYANYASSCEGA